MNSRIPDAPTRATTSPCCCRLTLTLGNGDRAYDMCMADTGSRDKPFCQMCESAGHPTMPQQDPRRPWAS